MRISPENLRRFCSGALQAVGMSAPDADTVAEVLVDANLNGIDTHGVSRLPVYASCLQRGRINPKPAMVKERTAPALGRMDGGDGLGILVGVKAMRFALELADEAGLGLVAVSRSSHCGAASYFCNMAAEAGKISMVFTNAPSSVPPWGGRTPYLGTNPLAFGFPGPNGGHVLVDMSTSVAARGHIIAAAKAGERIPEGWALDALGRPTTDPAEAMRGAVLPMGGPKGYALALAVEIMAGILTGAAFGKHVGWMYDESLEPVNVGHAFLALDVSRLMDPDLFLSRLAAMLDEIRGVALAEGHQAIHIPGERKRAAAAIRRQGVPVPDGVLGDLDALARQLSLPLLRSPA